IRPVPESVLEFTLSRELTAKAVETAVKRHAGKLVNGDGGKAVYAVGKDLTAVKWVIGTGGALTRLPGGTEIMASVTGEKKNALIPRQGAAVLLDNYYVFAALGVLAALHPTGAAYLMRESMGIER
ncbi:MAG TPA: glutamate mutase L, partial [Desulfobacteria bacterium]|nr:glutamate mutase L [Desulfobacteria bacterium]